MARNQDQSEPKNANVRQDPSKGGSGQASNPASAQGSRNQPQAGQDRGEMNAGSQEQAQPKREDDHKRDEANPGQSGKPGQVGKPGRESDQNAGRKGDAR